jgi:predicted TIM-barrel fold metal-dependent hydrolase
MTGYTGLCRFLTPVLRRIAVDFGKLQVFAAHFGEDCRGLWQGAWRISATAAAIDFEK